MCLLSLRIVWVLKMKGSRIDHVVLRFDLQSSSRMSAQQILEKTFFAIEPEVMLLTSDGNNVHLTLQVVFKGVDKRSVKFDFNVVQYYLVGFGVSFCILPISHFVLNRKQILLLK